MNDYLHPDHPDRQPIQKNPYDRTARVPEDADAEESEDLSGFEDVLPAREAALVDKRIARDLTKSEGWVRLQEFVEEQVHLRTDRLVLEPITDQSKDMGNFIRGEIAFGRMLLTYVRQMAETADATLDVFKEMEKTGGSGEFKQ